MKMKHAFTLAEVLITLVIIGVIGALTVPSLIQNTQKQEYVSALKKAYSTLSQAAQQIITEEGSPKCDDGGWACSLDGLYDIFKKHLNVMKDDSNKRKLYLADGAVILLCNVFGDCGYSGHIDIDGSKDICAYIYADVNGDKKPNKVGRDNFLFVLKQNGLYPAGCDKDGICMKDGCSYACTCKVLSENAVNY